MKVPATRKGASRGAAWLSSARVVRCWVKSRNERNPYPMLLPRKGRTLRRLPRITWRKAGMTSSPHGLYVQGCTRATMACTKRSDSAKRSKSQKTRPSSDRRLQLASGPLVMFRPSEDSGPGAESLVIAGQQHCGECVPEPCTK